MTRRHSEPDLQPAGSRLWHPRTRLAGCWDFLKEAAVYFSARPNAKAIQVPFASMRFRVEQDLEVVFYFGCAPDNHGIGNRRVSILNEARSLVSCHASRVASERTERANARRSPQGIPGVLPRAATPQWRAPFAPAGRIPLGLWPRCAPRQWVRADRAQPDAKHCFARRGRPSTDGGPGSCVWNGSSAGCPNSNGSKR